MDEQCSSCGRTHHPDYIHPDNGWEFRCMRCNHQWKSRRPDDYPKCCAKCHSAYWNRPPVRKSVGAVMSKGKVRKRKREKVKSVERVRKVVEQSGQYEALKPPPSFGKVR